MTRGIRHAVIMAAGRGRRLMPLTSDLPKPMMPYLDSTLVAHGIRKIRAHVPNVHVTVGYLAVKLAPHLVEQSVSSIINTEGHPNSWWLYNTLLAELDEPVFVLTCDNVTELDFAALEADYVAQGSPAGMLVPVTPVNGLEGDYIFEEDHLVTAVDRHRPSPVYCSGIQILHPARIRELTEEGADFYDVWRQLIERRELRSSTVQPERWFTVDTPDQLKRANSTIPTGTSSRPDLHSVDG
ncbi:MAG: sugar phosphate nucleotidyltransferase [Actinomycetota bacterium]|nr:sugar phosphate nucleotidyltransferase [Actinomycetota bacterium]MDA8357047.1 sugar phosphate nucleotidyltransferase [Actinomycetota bacterium]